MECGGRRRGAVREAYLERKVLFLFLRTADTINVTRPETTWSALGFGLNTLRNRERERRNRVANLVVQEEDTQIGQTYSEVNKQNVGARVTRVFRRWIADFWWPAALPRHSLAAQGSRTPESTLESIEH